MLLLGGVSFLTEYWSQRDVETAEERSAREQRSAPVAAAAPVAKPVLTVHPVAAEFAQKLAMRTGSPEEDLLTVQQLLLAYERAIGENLEGDNEDVVAALLGANKQQISFLTDGVNSLHDGRLLDRWGTPYFMRPESSRHRSLRSAGPDKHLFTDDDVVLE